MHIERRRRADPPPIVGAEIAAMIDFMAGLVAIAAFVFDRPRIASAAAVVCVIASIVLGVLSFRAGRRTGIGFWRCLGRAVKHPFDFLFSLA